MNKIRIIDLLKKIANGEEVPNKIKVEDLIWKYNYGMEDYWCEEIENYLMDKYNMMGCLNNEVEILEEEKKIPEIIDVISWDSCIHGVTRKEKELAIEINKTQKLLNQLIDYLKSKEKGE